MVENSRSLCQSPMGWIFFIEQSRQAISSRGQALSECFCWHLHQLSRDMTLHSQLASLAFKRKPATMGKRAPRAPSIVCWFSRLPWLAPGADSVALAVGHLALVAARAPPAGIGVDAQNGSTLATIPDGPAAVEPVGKWPRYGERARLFHVGRSDSPAQ